MISGISHPPDANRIESYVKCPDTSDKQGTLAAPDDVRHIIGNLDEAKLLDIVALHPTTRDVEQAFMWLAGERRYGSFERYLRMPEGVDTDKIEASFKNGVLTVTLPKKPEAQKPTKRIDVKAA